MPRYAIAQAQEKAKQPDLKNVFWQQGPPPSARNRYPSPQEIIERVIGEDEEMSEGLFMSRIGKFSIGNDSSIVVNGTTAAIANFMDSGLIEWANYREGTLRRRQPMSKAFVRSVFEPPAPLPRETKGLYAQIRELRTQLTGVDEVAFIHVDDGHALVVNKAKVPAMIHAFRGVLPHGQVQPNQIIECDADLAESLSHSGILETITVSDAQDLIASLH